MRRRRTCEKGYDALTADQQVQDVINNWGSMFPVLVVTEEQKKDEFKYSLSPDISDMEFFDAYFIPRVKYDIKDTEFERYSYEIIKGLTPLFFRL